jgi:hypothetical protein
LCVHKSGRDEYQEAVDKYARDGWRLVQIFAPGIGGYGAAKYYELVLERELDGGRELKTPSHGPYTLTPTPGSEEDS